MIRPDAKKGSSTRPPVESVFLVGTCDSGSAQRFHKRILPTVPVQPEDLARVVLGAINNVPPSRSQNPEGEPNAVPVRPPRPRNLARQLLEGGDALKADAKRFLSHRRGGVPASWTVDGIVDAEESLAAVGVPGGTFLGLLRFASDLQDDRDIGRTWAERRWWGLLRRRLASSSGIVLVRSVADGMEVVRHLVEEADPATQQGFTDLLRLVGARTGLDVIAQPRLADKALWEFAVLLASRTRVWNRSHAVTSRTITPIDFYLGGVMVFAKDRLAEPSLSDLRSSVFQTGAPLAPALDSWLRRMQDIPGSSLLRMDFAASSDPRDWLWSTAEQLVLDARPERLARLAACERGLIDLARRDEATREATAQTLEREVRQLLVRELPASRLASTSESAARSAPLPMPVPTPRPQAPPARSVSGEPAPRPATPVAARNPEPPTVRIPPRPVVAAATPLRRVASPVPEPVAVQAAPSDPLSLAMQEYETSTNLRTITAGGGYDQAPPVALVTSAVSHATSADLVSLDGLPVGFDLSDLERQAAQLEECLRTGLTPSGRQWIEKYRGLLGDARVREFLRFPAEWIGGLRDLLSSGDPWILAGMEDLIRYLYPSHARASDIEFRYNHRTGDPSPTRTGWDWVVLRLLALAVAETASGQGDPEFAPTPLVTFRRWQSFSKARDLAPHTPSWWSWLAEEVEARGESMYRRPFQVRAASELSLWRERQVKPWLAIPSEASFASLGTWARMPVLALRQDPNPSSERWASRLSMLGQLLEETKEDSLRELATCPI